MGTTTIYSFLEHLGFRKNILSDEGYGFYSIDISGIKITVSVLDEKTVLLNVCLHYEGCAIPLTECNSPIQIQYLLKALEWKEK